MGISSMQFKQAESFAKGTLSYVVQMWKLLSFTCELLYTVFLSYGISVSSSVLMKYCKMGMCSDQASHKKFSDVLHVAGVLFEPQDVNAFLLPVLWEAVKMFARQYDSTSKCFQWQPLILTFSANM